MKKLISNALAFVLVAGISSAVGQQISGGSGGGGGGTPGGSNTQVQYNNSGAFGGISGWTTNGTSTLTNTQAPAANTSTDGLILSDTTAASSGNQQYSPRVRFTGQGWKTTATAASQPVDWIMENVPVQGAGSPSSNLVMSSQVNGGGYVVQSTLSSFGDLTLLGNLTLTNSNSQVTSGAHLLMSDTTTQYQAGTGGNAGSGWFLCPTCQLGWAASAVYSGGFDTYLSRAAAANLQLGAADAAAPVAQKFQVQSVVAGTTDTAGTDWTIAGSKGTGTGAGGNIVFQTAIAGTTGSTQNAHVTGLIIDAKSHTRVGASTAPALTSCGTTPAISGTDQAGTVTMGTTATGCVITFFKAYASAPYCVVTWRAQALASQSYAISTTAITLTQTSASNNLVDYNCMARNAG